MIKNGAPLTGRFLESCPATHTNFTQNILLPRYETLSRPNIRRSERSAVALAGALAAPSGPFTPNGVLGRESPLGWRRLQRGDDKSAGMTVCPAVRLEANEGRSFS